MTVICPLCRSEMKPLFTGFYCTGGCDRPGEPPPKPRTIQEQIDRARDYADWVDNSDGTWPDYGPWQQQPALIPWPDPDEYQ